MDRTERRMVMNQYTVIELKDWKRAMHFQIFRDSVDPQYCVSMELDITKFLELVHKKGYSFTMAFIYAVTKCANEIEEFRYRFLDGNPVLFEQIDTSFTYLNEETELFKVVNVPMQKTMGEYVSLAVKTAKEQEVYFTGPMGTDVFQFSPFPWVSFLNISHTNSGKKDQATPIFDWGKYDEKDGKVMMPFSIQVHHSFVDGIHIGRLVKKLQQYLDKVEG